MRQTNRQQGGSPKPVTLIYGNQSYSVVGAAEGLADQILGEGDRDFSFHRFDAEEMLKSPSGDSEGDSVDAFQIACETTPFLCEHYVVRLDHLELVKAVNRGAQALQRNLTELKVFACYWEDERCWAQETDLLPTETREELMPLSRWISEIEGRTGAESVLHLTDAALAETFVLVQGKNRRKVGIKAFLREKLKGRFIFDGDEDVAPQPNGPRQGASKSTGGISARLHGLVERLVENPPPGLYLVLTATATRETDISKALLGKIKKTGELRKFVTYDDYSPVDWVMREARSRQLNLSKPLAELLIHLAGNDLGRLVGELDKLALLHHKDNPVTEEGIIKAVHGGQGLSLFLITERLGSKDMPGTLTVLDHFLTDNPNEHPVLVGILARFFRQLLHLHTLEQNNVPVSDHASQLKLHPFIAKKVAGQARRYAPLELEQILRALAAMDISLKKHGNLTAEILKEFVHGVCADGFRQGRGLLGQGLIPGARLMKSPGAPSLGKTSR